MHGLAVRASEIGFELSYIFQLENWRTPCWSNDLHAGNPTSLTSTSTTIFDVWIDAPTTTATVEKKTASQWPSIKRTRQRKAVTRAKLVTRCFQRRQTCMQHRLRSLSTLLQNISRHCPIRSKKRAFAGQVWTIWKTGCQYGWNLVWHWVCRTVAPSGNPDLQYS